MEVVVGVKWQVLRQRKEDVRAPLYCFSVVHPDGAVTVALDGPHHFLDTISPGPLKESCIKLSGYGFWHLIGCPFAISLCVDTELLRTPM